MSLSLGLDTGGTYTDAVIFDDTTANVISKAKALTTRQDLSIGISGAARKALEGSGIATSNINLVSISTTLATNALVEGQGGRVALVLIGFDARDLDRAGLKEALGSDPVIFLPGGHDVYGKSKQLDMSELSSNLDTLAQDVSAFAVAGLFAVRNPEHEIAVRDLIHEKTDLAVTCSHELSSKLDGPKRALTTLLNARLIDMIARLISATRQFLEVEAIDAPLMVVRGDGSLVSADFAMQRPIETILSGPAASLVGAHFLTGADDAVVSDIGGTTTDIALLDQGQPRIDEQGANVGGFTTMVEAVAMRTFGLGGDSEVALVEGGLSTKLRLGPRRFVPVSLLATIDETVVLGALERQLKSYTSGRMDGRFVLRSEHAARLAGGLSKSEAALLSRLTDNPQPLDEALNGTSELATLDALVRRGLAMIGGFTPSDAQHVLGAFSHWHKQAAELAANVFARRRDGSGKAIAKDGRSLAEMVVERLKRLSAEKVLETVFFEDGLDGKALATSPLAERALSRTNGIARFALFLDRPLVALGAGASAYYSDAADLLGAQCIVPEDADVANAIGAVVGQVRVSVAAEILQDAEMQFDISGAELTLEQSRFGTEPGAIDAARNACEMAARRKAEAAGAGDIVISTSEDIKASHHDGERQFVSATITSVATGRPSVAVVSN